MALPLTVVAQTHQYWWSFALRGLVAILFGVTALVWPGLTIAVLVLLFGAFAFVEGLFTLIAAIRARGQAWGWHVVDGVAGIAIGVITLFWPGLTGLGLLYAIALWAILTGLARIVAAIALRRLAGHPWLLGAAGLISTLVGVALVLMPVAGALAVVWLIGLNAIVIGALLIGLGLRLRSLRPQLAG